MNKARRLEVNEVIEILKVAIENIDCVVFDEQDAYDSLPEGLQSSSRGDDMLENVDDLESSRDTIEGVIEKLEDVVKR